MFKIRPVYFFANVFVQYLIGFYILKILLIESNLTYLLFLNKLYNLIGISQYTDFSSEGVKIVLICKFGFQESITLKTHFIYFAILF